MVDLVFSCLPTGLGRMEPRWITAKTAVKQTTLRIGYTYKITMTSP